MRYSKLGRFTLILGALALVSALALAACKDDDDKDKTPAAEETPAGDETPADGADAIDISSVPELEDGVLSAGSDIAYAPIEFYIEGTETPDGVDVDILNAIGEALGVQVEFINTGFDGIIPALQTEDYDVIMSAMTITPERTAEIDLVPYLNVGQGVLVPAGNPGNILGLEDLCGLTVAVQLGTIQVDILNEQNAQCDEQMTIVTFDTNPLAVEDLRTGGSDANFADFPVAFLDAEESDGTLELVEPAPNPQPYGIGVRKESTELKDVLADAVQAIKDSGTYDEILAEWGLESTALP
ncbi:MAG: ABC transporter substrate-binding protein [Dehalococcoidia bacterium]